MLLKEPGFIRMTDFGTHAPEIAWCRNTVPVRKIVKTSSVSRKYGRLLFRLAKNFGPVSILELGTSLGISSSYLALGNPEGTVTTIEGCEETAAFAKKNFEAIHLANVRIINSRFEDVLSYLLPEIGVLGMVFFDGNHRKEATLSYFHQCLPFIRDDSVFIFDDIHWSEEMEEAWRQIREHESVKVTVDLFRMGLVFFREGLSKEDFILRF
jgi:predicted O-methyltransferase YrrM